MIGVYAKRTCYHGYQSGSEYLTYTLSNCPYCLGTGEIHDAIFMEDGNIRTVERSEKLRQELEKIFIEELRTDGYGFAYATQEGLTSSVMTETRLRQAAVTAIQFLYDLQLEAIDRGQYLPPEEQIAEIGDILITQDASDPRRYFIQVSVKTLSAVEAEISLSLPLEI